MHLDPGTEEELYPDRQFLILGELVDRTSYYFHSNTQLTKYTNFCPDKKWQLLTLI